MKKNILPRFCAVLFLSLAFLLPATGRAQYSIVGNTCALPGVNMPYNISGGSWSTADKWCITGGTIFGGTGSCVANAGSPTASVTWNTGITTGTISYYHPATAPTPVATLTVTLPSGGTVTPGAVFVPSGVPYTINLTGTALPANVCGIPFTALWESGPSPSTLSPISNASPNPQNFSMTGTFTSTFFIERLLVPNSSSGPISSNPVSIIIMPAFTPGVASTSSTCILSGSSPGTLTATASTGGSCGSGGGTFVYQWQSSPDNVNWTNVGSGGPTATSYAPGPLSVTTYFRQMTSCGPLNLFTNTLTITVYPPLSVGTITTGPISIGYNSSPGTIGCTAATGGACSVAYTYQWQQSPDNSNWTNVPAGGADPGTGLNYAPGLMTVSTYFHRLVSLNGGPLQPTGSVLVTVFPKLSPGTISGPAAPIPYLSPAVLNNVVAPGGGSCSGNYHYQWLQSTDGINYQSIPAANASTYTSGNLSVTTYFIRQVNCAIETYNSNAVMVSVNPLLVAGTIVPSSLTIATGASPGILTGNRASGGGCSGSYSYLWMQSTDGVHFTSTGDTAQDHSPGNLSVTTYFERQVTCGTQTFYSNIATIKVGTIPATVDMDYIRTRDIMRPGVTDTVTADGLTSILDVHQITQFFDGLGRPVQTVAKQVSPLGNDMVSMDIYDPFGRESAHYLPYIAPSNDGKYKVSALSDQHTFNAAQFPGEQFYYSQTDFELSPLNRSLATYGPGSSWVGSNRAVTERTFVNTVLDNVQEWSIGSATGSLPVNGGVYAAGQLYKTITTNESGHQTIEYKDSYGQVVLIKIQNTASPDNGSGSPHAGWLCKYNVYDDYGNLRFIITPDEVQRIDGPWSISQAQADEFCYRYEYDLQNRMVVKKAPGTPSGSLGEVWMVHDARNRLVMVQDGNMRTSSQWLCFIYDGLDRRTMTGTIVYTGSFSQLQQVVTAQTVNGTSSPIPTGTAFTQLTATYYDNYNWLAGTGSNLSASLDQTNNSNTNYFTTTYNSLPLYAVPIAQSSQIQGQQTGNMVQVLTTSGPALYSLLMYDDHSRVIQSQSTNITGGKDIVTNQYSWDGKLLRTLTAHGKSGANPQTHLVASAMSYDAMGRVLTVTKTVNSTINGAPLNTAATVVATNQYNELGQLQQKKLGNAMESLNYDYNIRGWLLGVNRSFAKTASSTSNYFGYDLGYDHAAITDVNGTTIGSYATPSFNGDIAGTLWKSKGDDQQRMYDYSYDAPNRLIAANFNQQSVSGTGFDKSAGLDFSVSGLSFDANGNILTMNQHGWLLGGSQTIDSLSYTYMVGNNSDRLMNVIDNSPYNTNHPASTIGDFHYPGVKNAGTSVDYSYDANGNLTSDLNRMVSAIAYNFLNLPNQITISGGKGNIQYIYDGAGNKLQKLTKQNIDTVTLNGTRYPTTMTTTTTYLDNFEYKSVSYGATALASLQYTDKLQFLGHEEGRVRALYNNASSPNAPTAYAFDYFIRDNLMNVRVVLTDEIQKDIYPAATLEPSSIATEQVYYNIKNDASHVIQTSTLSWWGAASGSNYVDSNANITNPGNPSPGSVSAWAYKLNGQTGDNNGLGITLKVMAGDQVSIFGKSVWHNTGAAPGSFPVSGVLSTFINAFTRAGGLVTSGEGTISGAALNGASATTGPLTSLLNGAAGQPNPTVAPKAAINWILFNDQFVPISMGADLVSSTGDIVKTHSQLNLPMAANGYLYVYCSNESDIDVYFDNLQVIDNRGPLLEETHYYPAGLTMAGISDRAWNKLPNFYHYEGNEMQDQEFSDGTGLEEYDFHARAYDQQLGVWHNQDPASQFASPYQAMADNWTNGTDPNGKLFFIDSWLIGLFSGGLKEADKRLVNDIKLWGGLFTTDPHKTFFGRVGEVISRLTWQAPQEILGFLIAQVKNDFGGVNHVGYFDGATVVQGYGSGKDFTLGNIIDADGQIQIDPNNADLQHEYGHYLQSEKYGWAYLPFSALPNILHTESSGYGSSGFGFLGWLDNILGTAVPDDPTNWPHDPTEVDGNTRAYKYWQKYYPNISYNTTQNPIGSERNPGFFDYFLSFFSWPIETIISADETKNY